ncbi:MAG TPA: hypothetical protein VKM94_17510 [Blastocatellia bacterium]|nr:hypothetical protein [Blastocatellia bacterium]
MTTTSIKNLKQGSLFAIWCVVAVIAISVQSFAQEPDEADPAKAAQYIRDAVAVRGGDAFMKVTTVVSRGQYTGYTKGVSGDPQSFVDYVAYPARERTEFGKGDSKFVQSNSEAANWVYDGAQKMIRDQKEDQVKQFAQGLRYDLDALLRAAAKPGANVKVLYAGHREIWRNQFAESVRIEFGDGGVATVNLDPKTKLPLSAEYKTIGEAGPVSNEVRFYRWVVFSGVNFPTLQDFYRDGKQISRVSIDDVSINVPLPDKLFAKPMTVKEVK